MKTRKNLFVAALFITSAALTGCSSELQVETQQIATDAQPQTWHVSIGAEKGSGDITRTITANTEETSLSTTWLTTERVFVYDAAGTLVSSTDGLVPSNLTNNDKTAVLTGDLTKDGGFQVNDVLTLYYLKKKDESTYTGQDGTLGKIASDYDFSTATVTVTAVDASKNLLGTTAATGENAFQRKQAITKFILKWNGSEVDASQLQISATGLKTNLDGTTGNLTVTPPNSTATSKFFVAMSNGETTSQTYTFTATIGGNSYTATKSVKLDDGKYYYTDIALAKPASLLTITFDPTSATYDGSQMSPTVTVKDGETTLTAGTHYTLTTPDGLTDANTYTYTVTGTGQYGGTKTADFVIAKADKTIDVVTTEATVTVGSTLTRAATIKRGETTVSESVTYASSNDAIATVSNAGVITGVAPGVVTITITSPESTNYNAASQQTITINVKQAGIGGEVTDPTNGGTWGE